MTISHPFPRAVSSRRWPAGLLLLALCPPAPAADVNPGAGEALVATGSTLSRVQRDGAVSKADLPADLTTPLGSAWKLFMYSYLASQDISPPDYQCQGNSPEEAFCCQPGGRIDMDKALAQSCGLYFAPKRLGVKQPAWQHFWQEHAPQQRWLSKLANQQPATRVPVTDLLASVKAIPPLAARRAQASLLHVTLEGRGAGAVREFGSGLRVKTWTWDHPRQAGEKMGGFLGWLADDSPVWAATTGSSTSLFRDWSGRLAPVLSRPTRAQLGQACVQVNMFSRYPVADVRTPAGEPAPPGPLVGRYNVKFVRGTQLTVESRGELELKQDEDALRVIGRFDLDDYVARVVEREGAVEPLAAARALAIVARSYVVQNAGHAGGCYVIDDSSATQRVAAQPPEAAALAVAGWTEGLVLSGAPARYHRDQAEPGVLSWQAAVAAAKEGQSFDQILFQAFGAVHLASLYLPDDTACQPLQAAHDWLDEKAPIWSRVLSEQTGFEAPTMPEICVLPWGRPQVDLSRNRILIPDLKTLEDRLSLTHEWLHLAFAYHPRGGDEAYIEDVARKLNGL